MSVKLTDLQLVMMSAAAQREDRCLTAPETMKGAVVSKAGVSVALFAFFYNFVKIHSTLRTSPAIAGGVSKTLWENR